MGCRAEIIYGATQQELKESVSSGCLLGGFLSFLLLVRFPQWLNSKFDWNLTSGFGLGFWALVVGLIVIYITIKALVNFEEKKHRKKPPRCVRNGKIQYIRMQELEKQDN